MADLPPLCELRQVTHDYLLPTGKTLRVLDGISLDVRPREVMALLGPSGCGKSTIMRVLAGLTTPTGGTVLHRGAPLTGINPDVAMVFQSFALCPWMTASDNIRAGLQAQGRDPEQIRSRTDEVMRVVGLSGFAGAYPRELSGGMKQRIGIARALAVDRELLFMDEPFSQVDALTAESLRSEVIDLWTPAGHNPSSIVMVSHDIKEVVYMADRIVVLGANPGRIRVIVENKLPRPRDYRSPEFVRLVDQIHDLITGHELPDTPAPARPGYALDWEPLPYAKPSEIIGLVEYLSARRGEEDLFRISTDTQREFGRVISIVKAAEMLDLVGTPKRQVVLTERGIRFAKAVGADRERLWRTGLLELLPFREIQRMVERQPDGTLDRDMVIERIIVAMPQEDHDQQCDLLSMWGRFGNLFSYDEAAGRFIAAAGG